MAGHLTLNERHRLPYDDIGVERSHVGVGALGERSNATDHVAGTRAILDDPLDGAAGRLEVGRTALQPGEAGVGVCDHSGERLIDFVGNGSGQLTQGRDTRHMGEFGLGLAQCVFGLIGPDGRGYVSADATIAQESAVGVEERLAAGPDVDRLPAAILAAIHQVAEGDVGVERRPVLLPFLGFEIGVRSDIPTRESDQTGGSGDGIRVLRYFGDAMVWPCFPEPVRGGFSIVAEALLARTQSALCLFGRRDVGH
ncbi:hypothetical protein ACVIVD_000915 [Bradyrhizobium liaoningense]